jgi:hypothetical protein
MSHDKSFVFTST